MREPLIFLVAVLPNDQNSQVSKPLTHSERLQGAEQIELPGPRPNGHGPGLSFAYQPAMLELFAYQLLDAS